MVFGISLLSYGLSGWGKRQKKLNKQLDCETEQRILQLRQATKEDSQKKRIEDININIEEPVQIKESSIRSGEQGRIDVQEYINKCQQIENEIVSGFRRMSDSNFEVLTEKKNGIFLYDLILKSKRSDVNDKLIEIKYLTRPTLGNAMKSILHTLEIMVSSYKRAINPCATAVIIIVCQDDVDGNDMRYQLMSRAVGLPNLVGLEVEVIKESKIKDFNYNIFNI